ncbi:MAG TPA: hypothetical protein VHY30_10085 [Verrucomicrobiae bacterium]|jgi:hypothetical protein|nr:hypothetical protein [Verrucomicrobiae bacterium]
MKNKINSAVAKVGCGLFAGLLAPGIVHACACGCGVFDVGGSGMLPDGAGGMAFLQYDYMDQKQNWSGSSKAPAADNDDKKLESDFITLGLQYMFSSSWGVQAELPYTFRNFTGTDEGGNVASHDWSSLGDIRVQGIYTGFFADQSAGVTFGLKLPTGSFTEDTDLVDRDTQIGSGSTDILLGGFYRGNLDRDQKWDWFAQSQLDVPTLIQDEYRPGVELDTAAGVDYKGFSLGKVRISPLAQAIFSYRSSDSGDAADPDNTGYERILLSPGIEFHIHPVKIYADAEFPVFQNMTGDQLVAPVLFKVSASYMF